MMHPFPELTEELQQRAIELNKIGVKGGVAWNIEDTIDILGLLHKNYPTVRVLGGDLLRRKNTDDFEYIYANWYFTPSENIKDAGNSIAHAIKYLKNFINREDASSLYVDLVVDNEQLLELKKHEQNS